MVKASLLFIFASLVAGALYFAWNTYSTHQSDNVSSNSRFGNNEPKGALIVAVKNIEQGDVIKDDAVNEFMIEKSKFPIGYVPTKDAAVGRKARYGMTSGQIVMQHDLNPYPPGYMKNAVLSKRQIYKGQQIKPQDIETITIEADKLAELEPPTNDEVVGKRAKLDIDSGELISKQSIE